MENKNSKFKITDSLVIAVAPAFLYILCFLFQYGYCSRFGIPTEFIELNLFATLLTISGFLFITVIIFMIFLMTNSINKKPTAFFQIKIKNDRIKIKSGSENKLLRRYWAQIILFVSILLLLCLSYEFGQTWPNLKINYMVILPTSGVSDHAVNENSKREPANPLVVLAVYGDKLICSELIEQSSDWNEQFGTVTYGKFEIRKIDEFSKQSFETEDLGPIKIVDSPEGNYRFLKLVKRYCDWVVHLKYKKETNPQDFNF